MFGKLDTTTSRKRFTPFRRKQEALRFSKRPRSGLRFETLESRLVLDAAPLLISEFMADNLNTLADVDGDFPDWIEIFNPSDTQVSLDGWSLTDDDNELTKWQFPDVSINPLQHLVVFASNKDRSAPGAELHTNFRLDADGGYLALVEPGGLTVAYEFAPKYPKQLTDISYGEADTAAVWDALIDSKAPVRYRVPEAGDDMAAWTNVGFDDSTWTNQVILGDPSLVVTEIGTGASDWLEIQNVTGQTLDTSGWFVAVNDTSADNINDSHSVVWNLPGQIAPGEVLYKTDDPADNYFGSQISWQTGSGWVMIVDDGGVIVDFVPWGYGETDIESLNVDVGGLQDVTLSGEWLGRGAAGGAGQIALVDIEQTWSYEQSNTDPGAQWADVGFDDAAWPTGSALLYVENSGLPAAKSTPLTLGASAYYFRSHFTLAAAPQSVTELTISAVIDDGAIIYLNGVEVYRIGMPSGPVTHGTYASRTVSDANYEGPFTIPTDALVSGDNVIAVEIHQTNAGSSDIVMGLQMEAIVLEPALERIGTSDFNRADDFQVPGNPTPGAQNAALTVPLVPAAVPALTGVGFGDDPGFSDAVLTPVEDELRGVNASLFSRIEFAAGDTSVFDVLTLRMKYDDGFVAYLNGVEVARRSAPDVLAYNAAATTTRPAAAAVVFEEIDISDNIPLLRSMESNVLAIQGLNINATDDSLLILPELIATSELDGPQYMTTPTPRVANVSGALGLVGDTRFSVDRGFFDAPFAVEISSNTLSAEIRYTLDGSPPTATSGDVYTGPITLYTTGVLRAAAFRPGYIPTNVDTQTYIFLDHVLEQPTAPAGFPSSWAGTTADYQMDPDVVGNPQYSGLMRDSLLSLPTMSIVADVDDLFGADGIYSNPNGEGYTWERPASVEWIEPDGTTGFQVDAGLRIYGGAFRGMGLTRKKTFRLLFKGEYGPTKLDFPLFGADDAATSFDTIILRGGANDGWNNWGGADTQYIVDEFMRRTQLAFGQPAPHGTFVHLYVNGLYWGLYNPVERPEASFSATYFGGDKDNWDALNSGSPTGDSNTATWNAMLNQVRAGLSDMASYQRIQGNNPDGTDNPAFDDMLDVDNYIAYMFSNFWGGTGDWPGHNWYAASQRPPEASGWKFYNWDSEGAIVVWSDLNANVTSVDNSAAEPYAQLRNNEEFKLLFGDYVQQFMFNDGPGTSQEAYDRYQELADEVELAIIAESARWGDQARSTPYTLADWQSTRDYILNTYMPQRPDVVLDQMRAIGLYPDLAAPKFNQHGGQVAAGFDLTMHVSQTSLYEETVVLPEFTGSRHFVPTDNNLGTTWTTVGFDDTSWVTGQTGLGYEDSPAEYANLIKTPVRPQDTNGSATSIMLRIPFTVDDLADIDNLTLRMKYDDGYVAYINGQEVARRNFGGTPGWNSTASSHSDGQAVVFEDVDIPAAIGLLIEGTQNVLSIHALNTSASSSDMLVLPELVVGKELEVPGGPDVYYTIDGSDPRLLGGALADSAVLYAGAVDLPETMLIKARAFENNQWSALNAAQFFVEDPASAANLAITEINYNPYDPLPEELAVISLVNNDDFEFLELRNIGDLPVSLRGVQLTDGVQFDFDAGSVDILAPGESVLVVSNSTAFELRYGAMANVAGQYTGRLANGGEQIELRGFAGTRISRFEYNDSGSWPGRADGKGASLELIDPATVPVDDPLRTDFLEDGDSWRSSSEFGGSPSGIGQGPRGDVLVNEVLSHTDLPLYDTIELVNTTSAPIDIGGWYLSDASSDFRKYRIPAGTMIDAGGYLALDERQFNPDPIGIDFALNGAHGDDVWLMEADENDRLVRFVDHVDFPDAAEGESFGRWPDAQGKLYPMRQRSLGFANTGPRIGPVVISELMYNPTVPDMDADPNDFEYIEIYNPTLDAIDLTNWRIRKGIDFNFPAGSVLSAAETLLVVPFAVTDAARLAALRDYYGLDSSVRIMGPYSGQLDDDGEKVQLQRPDSPPADELEYIPHLIEDEVVYGDVDPWPTEPDGLGTSLARRSLSAWGNDAASWVSEAPTPGSVIITDDSYEPNNSLATASLPAADWSDTPLSTIAGLGIQADADWYRIDVPESQRHVTVDVTFSHALGNIDVQLVDASGSVHAASQTMTDNEQVDAVLPHPGTWYLNVFGENTANAYDLVYHAGHLHPGDADLSGATDLSDFNIWNANKFIAGTDWTAGDFNGDGNTDLSDFNIWNAFKFTTAPPPNPTPPAAAGEFADSTATLDDLAWAWQSQQSERAKQSSDATPLAAEAVDRLLATYWE